MSPNGKYSCRSCITLKCSRLQTCMNMHCKDGKCLQNSTWGWAIGQKGWEPLV